MAGACVCFQNAHFSTETSRPTHGFIFHSFLVGPGIKCNGMESVRVMLNDDLQKYIVSRSVLLVHFEHLMITMSRSYV